MFQEIYKNVEKSDLTYFTEYIDHFLIQILQKINYILWGRCSHVADKSHYILYTQQLETV